MNFPESQLDKTIEFYNKNSKRYFERTVKIDLLKSYNNFFPHIPAKGRIFDVGCGSGRDVKVFLELGYEVVAIDASNEMVKLAIAYTNHPVIQKSFMDISYDSEFDGIWANASLLHVPSNQFLQVMEKLNKALKPNGVMYLMFRYGDFEGVIDDRYYNYFTKERLKYYIDQLDNIKTVDLTVVKSYEEDNSMTWLHCFIQKGH